MRWIQPRRWWEWHKRHWRQTWTLTSTEEHCHMIRSVCKVAIPCSDTSSNEQFLQTNTWFDHEQQGLTIIHIFKVFFFALKMLSDESPNLKIQLKLKKIILNFLTSTFFDNRRNRDEGFFVWTLISWVADGRKFIWPFFEGFSDESDRLKDDEQTHRVERRNPEERELDCRQTKSDHCQGVVTWIHNHCASLVDFKLYLSLLYYTDIKVPPRICR